MAKVASFEIEHTRFLDPAGEAIAPLPAFAGDVSHLEALYRAMVLTRVFDAKAGKVRDQLTGNKALGSAREPAIEFIDRMKKVRAFMAPVLELRPGDLPPGVLHPLGNFVRLARRGCFGLGAATHGLTLRLGGADVEHLANRLEIPAIQSVLSACLIEGANLNICREFGFLRQVADALEQHVRRLRFAVFRMHESPPIVHIYIL